MSAAGSSINAQILDEAAEWFVTLRHDRAEAAVHERFMAWLRTSPEHVRAYLGIVGVWSDLPNVDSLQDSDVHTLIEQARVAENVVSFGESARSANSPEPGEHTAQREPSRKVWFSYPRAAAAASLILVGIVLALVLGNEIYGRDRYSTGIGEQRILRLPDGSKVELNSRSRIQVRYSQGEREVELVAGQALFEVAKDPRRPFLVCSDSAQMRALGTKFDVYRKAGGTTVTVVEGRVAIGAAASPEHEIVLAAGERVIVKPRSTLRPSRADVAAATAWTQGQLMFRSEPLSSVVEEFNRYNRQQIVLEGPLEDFPVTAVFSSVDPRLLVEFLNSQPGLQARSSRDEIRIVAATSPPAKMRAPVSPRAPL